MVSKTSLAFALTTFLTSTLAIPATFTPRQDSVCSNGNPLCCKYNAVGVADLDCEAPPGPYNDVKSFKEACASIGKISMCCSVPILDQGLVCNSPNGS
ncbi:hypothetical protein MFRU_007g03690 [Monilinia fructicola]|nr:hypothetical protein MFRU_007g03690 [Monilinia fructicola]